MHFQSYMLNVHTPHDGPLCEFEILRDPPHSTLRVALSAHMMETNNSINFDNPIRRLISSIDSCSGYGSFSDVDSPTFSFAINVVRSIAGVGDYLTVRSPRELPGSAASYNGPTVASILLLRLIGGVDNYLTGDWFRESLPLATSIMG